MINMQRISAQAYQALRDALPTITWHKRAFESFLRDALRAHPKLLAGLDFNGATKRQTADALINRLVADEATYQPTTIDLMLEVAVLTQFSNIEQIAEPNDRALRLQQAQEAVGRLRTLVAPYRGFGRHECEVGGPPGRLTPPNKLGSSSSRMNFVPSRIGTSRCTPRRILTDEARTSKCS